MTTVPGVPMRFADYPSVQIQSPPARVLEATTKVVLDATNTLGPNERGALMFVVTTTGVNLAAVHKVNDRFAVVGWVGKAWGEPVVAGVAGSLRW